MLRVMTSEKTKLPRRSEQLETSPDSYEAVYQRWRKSPSKFWAEAAENVHWYRKWDRVLDTSHAPFYKWFHGAVLNTCYNALDVHVAEGRGDQLALIYDSPVTRTTTSFTYRALLDEVARFAGVLEARGVSKHDRIIIYMPMVPEAVVAMLAAARLGAIHSVVFGGFSAAELSKRIEDARPKVIVSASCGIEITRIVPYKPLLDRAIEMSSWKPSECIILQRPQQPATMVANRDNDWSELMMNARPVDCVPVMASDPLYILYTSGTTGIPKGVVRDNAGHLVALKWSMQNVYGVAPGEVFWAASDLGWAVGHSYIVYGPLFHGNTTVLYEGKPVGTPDAAAFWRVVSQYKVRVMFTAPTAIRAIKREDPSAESLQGYDLSHFRTLFLAGERCDPDTLAWAGSNLNVPVIDNWWQTETGWPIGANLAMPKMFPVKAGSCGKPMPGYDVRILDDHGVPASHGLNGNVAIRLPLPPGCLLTLWNNDEGYRESYLEPYPGYYRTGDSGCIDDDGYVWIMGRTDDIINVAGHRLSTGGIEEVLATHPDVAECAVIGVADELKGEIPLALVVLKKGSEARGNDIPAQLVQSVREKIGPVASFKLALIVNQLPKTRSGKIVRGTIKKLADGAEFVIPPTIEDPFVLDDIRMKLTAFGFPRK
ncbi:MAG TPA: propionyl-CoA synthetase [Pyrinomonadaceae bacterium]|nr:propionyl-CoA synthetase [Pyrinomonadaceae bacterium]